MNELKTLTDLEILRYITETRNTPETRRWMAEVDLLLQKDKELERRVTAVETLFESVCRGTDAERRALLIALAREQDLLRVEDETEDETETETE